MLGLFSKDPKEKEQRKKEKEHKTRLKRAMTAGGEVDKYTAPRVEDILNVKQTLSTRGSDQEKDKFSFPEVPQKTPPPMPPVALKPVSATTTATATATATTQPLSSSPEPNIDFRSVLKRNKSLKEVEENRKAKIEESAKTNVIDWKVKAKLQSTDKIISAWDVFITKKDGHFKSLSEQCITTRDLINGLMASEALAHPSLKEKGSELLRSINDIKTDMATQMKHLESKIQLFNETVNDCMERNALEKKKELEQQNQQEQQVQVEATPQTLNTTTLQPNTQASKTNNKRSSGLPGLPAVDYDDETDDKVEEVETKLPVGRSHAMSEPPPPPVKLWKALFDYPGGYRQDGELIFKKDTIVVSTREEEAWLYGYIRESQNSDHSPPPQGWFPANYVGPISK